MTWLAQVQATLNAWLADPGVLRLVFVVLLAAVAFTLALALSFLVWVIIDPLRRRVGAMRVEGGEAIGAPKGPRRSDTDWAAFLKQKSESKRGHIAESLLHAGYRSPNAVRRVLRLQVPRRGGDADIGARLVADTGRVKRDASCLR